MTAPGSPAHPRLTAADVLDHVAVGVIVTDRDCGLQYANQFAVSLFGFPDDAEHLAGRPLLSLGIEQADAATVQHMAENVLRGWPWEGTFASQRVDGSRVFVRAQAAPLRDGDGEITGIMIMAREATRRGGQRASDRIGLLERIGERLSSSLELDVTLRQVAETLVPQFADHCFIDLLHGETLVRRAQFNSRGWTPPSGSWALVGEQIKYPRGHFCEQAMSQLETVVVADLAEQAFPVPRPESQQICDDIRLTSVIAAPLVVRGQLLGVMSLALSMLTERDERHYGADDRDFLSAIASRVAIAIDNSLLFEEERRTALAFQTSLLPKSPPFVDGLDVAYKYVPAKPLETHGQGIQTQVGGDWYDIIPLSAGRVGIVIGDVEGRGARAAAVMGQLRAALRAFAQDDKSPAEILRRLDDWVRSLDLPAPDGAGLGAPDPPTVSCTYLVYDAWSRTLSFSNAGHVPPLLVRGHDVSQLEISDRGVLLGVRGKGVPGLPTYREEMRYLAPGSTLVFYTDGLVDRRQRADGSGVYTDAEVQDMLRRAVRGAAGGSVQQVAEAAERAVPGEIDDDMAVVVVRTSEIDLASWEAQFPAEPVRVSEARRLAHETFLGWGMDTEQTELACLLVSEVVTNVVLHAAATPTPRHEFALEGIGPGPLGILGDWELSPYDEAFSAPPGKDFTLRLRRGQEAIWVEVLDSDLRLPRIRSAGESDEGGRGLYLVDQLATRWGSRPTKDGKAVWFEMPIKGGAASLLL
ncbi:MAG TPA: SpoIIE family protein phosphatase [Streptosporangiaceae bacterium]|nr:SpoIIE family protein phosphatase [Streptosporangiaceae bacterium]